jgi:hypothetical protein
MSILFGPPPCRNGRVFIFWLEELLYPSFSFWLGVLVSLHGLPGTLPEDWATFGRLGYLNLQGNMLSGMSSNYAMSEWEVVMFMCVCVSVCVWVCVEGAGEGGCVALLRCFL